MNYNKLADLLLPDLKYTAEELENKYRPRDLPEGAMVTRFAPSPTGFMHLGGLFGALIDERLARVSGGVMYLRIEDTDQKREVEGSFESIINIFDFFGIKFDEGATLSGDIGGYGPYTQSERRDIYYTFAKELIKKGLCYPCFCSEEEIEAIRNKQQEMKNDTIGYYGKWAKCRSLSYEEIEQKVQAGEKFILRLKSQGDETKRISVVDLIKGELDPPENMRDEIVIKSDGLPTYHFAHVVDDHLMKTTHVVRGEEWLPSLPTHIQMFEAMGWRRPHYLHTATLMKQEGSSKRKLSKRKDPELALSYYQEQGIFPEATIEYLMTILNSNFEEWRIENPTSSINEFKFTTEKLSPSGALFDLAKLNDVSKSIIAMFKADEIYNRALVWAKEYDAELYKILSANREKVIAILNIGRNDPKPRKDIASLNQIKDYIAYFFDELFDPDYTLPKNIINKEDAVTILSQYKDMYNGDDDQTEWFNRIRDLAAENSFAEMKVYKKNPSGYKGHVGDVSGIIRAAVCGRSNTPDMHAIFKIMTKPMVTERIDRAVEYYSN